MGEEARLPELKLDALMAFRLKNLKEYRVTSPRCTMYNCVAWALSDQSRWFEPGASGDPQVDYYWPDGVFAEDTLASWIALFELHGFITCDNGTFERNVTKITIYGSEQGVTHVARQLASGWWASKLGKNVDIEHRSYEELECELYGKAVTFMKRSTGSSTDGEQHE